MSKRFLTPGSVFRALLLPAAALAAFTGEARAQTCGSDYVIQANETLRDIAQRAYGDPQAWTFIFYANGDRLGSNTTLLVPGLSIRIPCLGGQKPAAGQPAAPAPAPAPATQTTAAPPRTMELSTLVKRIEFLTADGAEPFAGRTLFNGGMLTDVLSASMNHIKTQANGSFDYGISWVNDWGAHLNPLLVSRAFDVGFPWTKPDCANLAALDTESRYRCQKFFFSDPLAEVVTLLFVKKGGGVDFASDEDVVGRRLCQPAGGSAYDLDKDGRNWVNESKVTLLQPKSMEECFRWLDSQTVDAVIASELVGRTHVNAMGLADRIEPLERPLAIGALHAIVVKTHPFARTILYYINGAVAQLRTSGEYDSITEAHLTRFWESQEKDIAPARPAPPAPAPAPAAAPAVKRSTPAPAPAPAAPSSGSSATDTPAKKPETQSELAARARKQPERGAQ